MVSRLKLRVYKLNTYLRCVDGQEARLGAEGIDGTTGCGYSNVYGVVMVLWMGVSRGNCTDDSKSNSKMRMQL
jgi:hypothetical protein